MTFDELKKVLRSKKVLYREDLNERLLLPDDIIKQTHVVDKSIRIFDENNLPSLDYDRLLIWLETPSGYNEHKGRVKWTSICHICFWNNVAGESRVTISDQTRKGISEMSEAKGDDEISQKVNAILYLHIKAFYDAYKEDD